jgi:hypothetical protein
MQWTGPSWVLANCHVERPVNLPQANGLRQDTTAIAADRKDLPVRPKSEAASAGARRFLFQPGDRPIEQGHQLSQIAFA